MQPDFGDIKYYAFSNQTIRIKKIRIYGLQYQAAKTLWDLDWAISIAYIVLDRHMSGFG